MQSAVLYDLQHYKLHNSVYKDDRLVRHQAAVLLTVLLTGFILSGTASSQPEQLRPGVVPGQAVEVPNVVDVLGRLSTPQQPALVVFTRLVPCLDTCNMLHRVLTVWAEEYPEIGIHVVSLRNTEGELRELAASRYTPYYVFADSAGAWEAQFQTNLNLTMFLVDEQGIVRTRFHGLDPQRVLGFDRIMALAAEGRWEELEELAERPLQVGQRPVPLHGLAITPGQPTVVYFTDSNCLPCSLIIEQGLQRELNALASRYPSVRFVVLDRQYPKLVWDVFSDFIARFGKSALPESLVELLHFVGPESEVELVQLPTEGWQPNVEVVRYFAGDQSDPGLKWGKHGTPDLAFFDEQGRFLGPDPVWMPGTYSPASVTTYIEQLILTNSPR